jgi:hypothetical protein
MCQTIGLPSCLALTHERGDASFEDKSSSLLDGARQCTGAESCETSGCVEFGAGQLLGRRDGGQTGYEDIRSRASMTAEILDGRAMSAEIKEQVHSEVRLFVEKQGQAPGLVIVRVGAEAASGVYSKVILRMAEEVDIHAHLEQLPVHT